jgi:hypothetical protein
MAAVQLTDVIVPEIFTPYTQLMTEQKSALIRSGALVMDAELSSFLNGPGSTFNKLFFNDLSDVSENISNDNPAAFSTPQGINTGSEVQVRLSRNQSWSSMDLVSQLIAKDPMDAIANRVSDYWVRRYQDIFVATMKGVFADNDAAPAASEHVQFDLTHDISGSSFGSGVTSFSAEAFVDATLTMGDRMGYLSMIMVHSIVYGRMQKNDMIDYIQDSVTGDSIPTFRGRAVVVDDGIPFSGGVFESWLFGQGAVVMGAGSPKVATETIRVPSAGNGGGQETLHNRVELAMHPVGHQFAATYTTGGPSNAATSGNLAHAASWKRVFAERKQIRIARLKTREF